MRRALALLLAFAIVPSVAGTAGAADEITIEDDIIVESSDGTPIVATLMLPAGASESARVPAVLQTHGWGGTRAVAPAGILTRLLDEGYAILTWDSRGFGESGGEANVGAPEYEVEDAKAMLDYLAARPEIQTDRPGDPRVGWIGGSNAAGVQFNTAALDGRVDAIVPEISWGYLPQDLAPNGVVKQSWDALLYAAGGATAVANGLGSPAGPQTGVYAQQIHQATVESFSLGVISEPIRQWFGHRSTTTRSAEIRTPTLIIQGTIDTLFPIEDAFENYRNLVAARTPVKLITYCSGHTIAGCSYPGGASGYPEGAEGKPPVYEDRIVAWLNRYVQRERVSTGPRVEWQAQDGRYYGAPRYPLPGTHTFAGETVSTGTIAGPGPGGGDGPADGNPAPAEELGRSAVRSTVLGPFDDTRSILGVPRAHLTGTVTGAQGFAFLELIDVAPDGTLVTVDDQVMPVALAGGAVDRTFDLHGVSWRLEPGHTLELEVTTGSAQYAIPRTGPYALSLTADVTLPVTRA